MGLVIAYCLFFIMLALIFGRKFAGFALVISILLMGGCSYYVWDAYLWEVFQQ